MKNLEFYPLEGLSCYAELGFSPNDTYLWQWQPNNTAHYDTISVWDTQIKQLLTVFHVAKYSQPCISPDEQYLLLKNNDSKISIYATKTWSEVSQLLLKSEAKEAQFFKESQLVALPKGREIGIFAVITGKQIAQLTGMIFAISPDENYIATETYYPGTSCLSIYNAHTFELLQEYTRDNASWPIRIEFNRESNKVLTAFIHVGGYSLWDIEHNQELFECLDKHTELFVVHNMTSVIECDNLSKKIVALKDLQGTILHAVPIQVGSEISLSPAQTYLNVCHWSENKLYTISDLEHKPYHIEINKQLVISPRDTYYATAGTHNTIQVFLLNIFKHFSLNFKQLLALIIVGHALQYNEPLDMQALELLQQLCPHVLQMLKSNLSL